MKIANVTKNPVDNTAIWIIFSLFYLMCVGDCQTTIDNLTLIDSINENNTSESNVTEPINEIASDEMINLNPSVSPISSHSVPPPSASSSVSNFLHQSGQKKNFGYDFLSKLRPAEIFRPIAEKFSDMVNSFYPSQPYINNDYFGYGSNNYGPYPLTLPALLLEKLNVKKQQFYSNAHGAIFGTGYYGHEDYPFAVRTVTDTDDSTDKN